MDFMKKAVALILTAGMLLGLLSGCGDSLLSPDHPVTLTMWHVYGEQSGSPMDVLVDEFNETVGQEQGIIIEVTNMTNSTDIGQKLLDAQKGNPGAMDMPDLFTCHPSNAVALGTENLLDWSTVLQQETLDTFVPEFLEDGTIEGQLSVLPLSKSTHLIMMCGTAFDRFAADTGVTGDSLATWDGFFEVAERYYEWSGGQPFCSLDYLIRAVELYAMELGGSDFYTESGWYRSDNKILKESWLRFASAIGQGHIMVSDLYSNTQVMTGEVICGIGSSAAILYYNDTVTYADGTSEPMNFTALPMPAASGATPLMTQAGVGLSATKTTEEKAAAAGIFAQWLTESQRNLDFVAETGYMPVTRESTDHIASYSFTNSDYTELYTALGTMLRDYTAYSEPQFLGYYDKVYVLYEELRERQKNPGEDPEAFTQESWEFLCSLG